ncbi:MAG: class I SAM-dependent methyltransferase [Pseudomonadota bacterium]
MATMIQPAPFWDKIAEKYAKQPVADVPTYEHTLARTRAYLRPTDQVLELGCGTGSTALTLSQDVAQVTATDISGEMIRIAEAKAEGFGNVAFQRAAADADEFADGAFDAVLGYNLLHLLETPMRTVLQAHRVLKPGGVFITKTPCLGDGAVWLRLVIPVMQAFGKAPYVGFPKAAELDGMMREAGFEIVTAEGHGKRGNRFIAARKM